MEGLFVVGGGSYADATSPDPWRWATSAAAPLSPTLMACLRPYARSLCWIEEMGDGLYKSFSNKLDWSSVCWKILSSPSFMKATILVDIGEKKGRA